MKCYCIIKNTYLIIVYNALMILQFHLCHEFKVARIAFESHNSKVDVNSISNRLQMIESFL